MATSEELGWLCAAVLKARPRNSFVVKLGKVIARYNFDRFLKAGRER